MKNQKHTTTLRSFLRGKRGANMVEYILLVGVVALLCVGAYRTFGQKVIGKIGEEGRSVGGIEGTAGTQKE